MISRQGSYCVPSNIVGVSGKSGIRIDSDSVTPDPGGVALLGVSGSQMSESQPQLEETKRAPQMVLDSQ